MLTHSEDRLPCFSRKQGKKKRCETCKTGICSFFSGGGSSSDAIAVGSGLDAAKVAEVRVLIAALRAKCSTAAVFAPEPSKGEFEKVEAGLGDVMKKLEEE